MVEIWFNKMDVAFIIRKVGVVYFGEYLPSPGLAALPTCTVALSVGTGRVHRLLEKLVWNQQAHLYYFMGRKGWCGRTPQL